MQQEANCLAHARAHSLSICLDNIGLLYQNPNAIEAIQVSPVAVLG